jgi:hypothetical protein
MLARNPSPLRTNRPSAHSARQIPRIDISDPANQIEYHPALMRTAGDDVEGGDEDEEEDAGGDDDEDEAEDDLDDADPSIRLPTAQAAKLLVLIAHARTCPGHHLSRSHSEVAFSESFGWIILFFFFFNCACVRGVIKALVQFFFLFLFGQVCKSVKYLMLHIRDCCGKTPDGSECGFPWCRPCKYLIHHLVKCHKPDSCQICSPWDLPPGLVKLRALNQLRDSQYKVANSVIG